MQFKSKFHLNVFQCKREPKVLISCSHLLQTSNGTQTKDFCEAFAENGFEISYEYDHNDHLGVLFIDYHYWQIVGRYGSDLHLYSKESKVINDWFGNQYRTAFKIEFCKQSKCQDLTGLLNVRNLMIDSNDCKFDVFYFSTKAITSNGRYFSLS